jgi:hypothetical protein
MARTKNTPAIEGREALMAAFEEFLTSREVPASETPAKKATTRTKTPRIPKGCLTALDVWTALGSDPTYAPKNPARVSFLGKQLDLLNSQGRLRIVA